MKKKRCKGYNVVTNTGFGIGGGKMDNLVNLNAPFWTNQESTPRTIASLWKTGGWE